MRDDNQGATIETNRQIESAWDHTAGRDLLEDMRAWRRHFHAQPELGFQEHDTTEKIRALLDEWDVQYSSPLSTATVAHLIGDEPGPVLMIRGDIDALPIQEEGQASYASARPGVMHACGHDGHTAILLGLAKLLSRNRSRLRGEIRLVFQPAEELVDGGAAKLVAAGVLAGVTASVGLHLNATKDVGHIVLNDGPVCACDDEFEVVITGKGGHGSEPHKTTDALTIAAGLVGQMQTLVSRRIDPLSPAVVSVGTLHAGDVYNAIPGEARLTGTARTLSPQVRDHLQRELIDMVKGYAAAHHATAQVTYRRGAPPVINDSTAVSFVRPAAEAAVGRERVTSAPPLMGGEDFAFFAECVPSAFVNIGAGREDNFPHHHPRFDFDESALAIGLQFFANVVERWIDPEVPLPDFRPPEETHRAV